MPSAPPVGKVGSRQSDTLVQIAVEFGRLDVLSTMPAGTLAFLTANSMTSQRTFGTTRSTSISVAFSNACERVYRSCENNRRRIRQRRIRCSLHLCGKLYVVPFLAQFWMFDSPVAYPSSLVPAKCRPLYGLNPMARVIEGLRWSLTGTGDPPSHMMLVSAAMVAPWWGHDVFSKDGIQNRGCGVNRAALCPSQFAACRQLDARNTPNGVAVK